MATRNFSISLPDETIEQIEHVKEIVGAKGEGIVSRNFVIRRWIEDGLRKWRKEGLLP